MQFQLNTFKELTVTELYDVMVLRNEVFVVEQKCAYQDLDGKDNDALHVLGFVNNELAAYARILKPGAAYTESAIGRVVVAKKFRGRNFGNDLMIKTMDECMKHFNSKVIIVSAQKYLEKFYSDLGFVTEGEGYLEDDIPHIKMRHSGR